MKIIKPKIFIAIMSCNNELYLHEEQKIKDTWIRFIENFENIDYVIFKGGEKTEYNNHELILNVEDDLAHTYQKNLELFKWIKENNIEYDYFIRTNCSTFLNIPLINDYLTYHFNNYCNDNRIMHIETHWVDNVYIFTGKFFIFRKKHIEFLMNNIQNISFEKDYYDDYYFSKAFMCGKNISYENSKGLSNYDYMNFKQLPVKFINNIPTKIDNINFEDIKSYSDIETCLAVCCKPFGNNDEKVIHESLNKLYNIVLNEYKFNKVEQQKIYNFSNNNFSHNQTLEKMFIHYPTICLVLQTDQQDKLNEYISVFFDKQKSLFFHINYLIVLTSNKNLSSAVSPNRLKIIYKQNINELSRAEVYNEYKHLFRFFIFNYTDKLLNTNPLFDFFYKFNGKFWDYFVIYEQDKSTQCLVLRGNLEKIDSFDEIYKSKSLVLAKNI